jgi:hypothetical protein
MSIYRYQFASHNQVDGFRKTQSFFGWILITNCWFKCDHILFLLDTFHIESEGLPARALGGFEKGK